MQQKVTNMNNKISLDDSEDIIITDLIIFTDLVIKSFNEIQYIYP